MVGVSKRTDIKLEKRSEIVQSQINNGVIWIMIYIYINKIQINSDSLEFFFSSLRLFVKYYNTTKKSTLKNLI